jgi:hypothetical protein
MILQTNGDLLSQESKTKVKISHNNLVQNQCPKVLFHEEFYEKMEKS